MKRVVVQKSVLDQFDFLEKSKKGEVRGGEYIHREEIGEIVTTDSKGNKRTRRYKYYYVDDMLKDSAETILDKIMSFFYKKFPENKERIEKSYTKENIQKDYGVDKKTYFQHVMEYLSHKAFWDNKFANPTIRKKYEKPVKENPDVEIDDPDVEVPKEEVPEIKTKTESEKKPAKKWNPNKSLMRKIWTMNSGKTVIKQEEQEKQAAEKLNQMDAEINPLEEHENRSNAMLGNDNAKKDGIIEGEEKNGKNKTNSKQGRISRGDKNLRKPGSTDSNENVLGSEIGNNNGELLLDSGEPGNGPANAEEFDFSSLDDGSGRIGAKQALKIREACRKLLAEKTDAEMTNEDKALLAHYVGAGGTKEEGASSKSILTEFYTPRKVVNKCWELLDKWLPNKKTCIEPSSGIGRFAEGRQEKFTMFEYEPESARIAKILHPNAEVVQGAFEKNWVRGGRFHEKGFEKFDCSVGNPPYMEFTGEYKGRYNEGKEFVRAEQYFLNRTLDSLKDNGVLVFVMPSSFLQGNSAEQRKAKELIASKGKLLEAWRLPNGSFDTTQVGTDIIVVRKEKGDINDFIGDNYFKNNPSHIAGDVVDGTNQFGEPVKYVQCKNGETFESAVDGINAHDVEAIVKELPKAETVIKETPEEKHQNRSNAMKGNKNAAGKHFVESIGKNMTAEEFNHKYGMDINKQDLDIWKFTDYNGFIDTTKLTKEQKKYIEQSKNYVKDGNEYINVVNYASGNIREKMQELEVEYKGNEISHEDYEYKKSILEAAMPAEKEIGQFTLSPISDWTRKYVTKEGMSLIQGFYEWLFNGRVDFKELELPMDSPVAPEEIAPEISLKDIIDYIERKELRSSVKDGDTTLDRVKVKFRKAEKRRENAETLFNKYLKEGLSKEDQEDLKNRWNTNFNAYRNPDYEKMPIFIEGMNDHKGTTPFTLTKQQLKGISFLTNKGSGLLAYDVGVGKTVTGLCATVNQIQTGRAKKPLICVPNAVYEKWITEIHQHFPNLKVNELKNFSKNYLSRDFVPEDGSISICTYEALEKVTFKDETMNEINSDVEYATMRKSEKTKTQRQLAMEKEKADELAGRMAKSDDDFVYFEDLGFDHITVDEIHNFKNIFYAPRNVNVKIEGEQQNKQSNEFAGLNGSQSDRGEKLFAITQYIQRHNDNRNVFGLSATPFQNSPIEIYNILSLFARQRMKDLGIYSLEEFVKQFAKLKSEYAITATEFREKMVMKSFSNLTALQNLITEYIDKVDGGEAHVIRPEKQVHLPKLNMTDLQREIMDAEAAYIEEQSKLPKEDRDPGAILSSLNAMRMATLSPCLVLEGRFEIYQRLGFDIQKPADKDFIKTSPKLKFVCDSVIAQYKHASNEGQVVYMPRGVKNYPYVVDYLVKNGIPRDAIATMEGGNTEKELIQNEEITKEFNDIEGKCKIIIGSEHIKEGVSLNGNSTVLYNLMLGWNPTEPQQVEGRIWRQGNRQGITHIVYPLLNDSLDPMMYQKYDEKKSRISEIFSYKGDTLNVDEIDAEELKFELIKDPRKRADLKVRQDVEKAESDQKLYEKMIDVMAKQAYIAFTDLKDNPKYAKLADDLRENQKRYDVFYAGYKQWEQKKAAAEKAGNEAGVKLAEGQMKSQNDFLVKQKVKIEQLKKEPRRMENAQKSMRESLAKRGIKSMDDANKKRQEYAQLMIKAREAAEKAEELREVYYAKAVEDLAESVASLPDNQESVNILLESVRSNLHPMDEEWITKLKKENEEKYGVKKSMPLFFIKDGRFLIRK